MTLKTGPTQIELLHSTVTLCFAKALVCLRIDKEDDFAERKPFWKKLGDLGLLGITASSQYGGDFLEFL
jgi:alkylation response protein AidB-like acyl-CoA dehydrogenase